MPNNSNLSCMFQVWLQLQSAVGALPRASVSPPPIFHGNTTVVKERNPSRSVRSLNVITGTVSCQGSLCWPRTNLWHLCLGACEIERASSALVAAVNINAASKHGVITQTEGRAVSIEFVMPYMCK